MTCPAASTVVLVSVDLSKPQEDTRLSVSFSEPCSDVAEATETGSSLGEGSRRRPTDPWQGLGNRRSSSSYTENEKRQEEGN
jgi:hypothetical protein